MSEANELTQQIIDFLYRNGIFSYRASSTGLWDQKLNTYRTAPKVGVSDIIAVFYNGRIAAIEVKIGKDSLRPEQRGFLANVERMGGLTYVAKDFDEFKNWFFSLPVRDTKPPEKLSTP